MMVEEGVKVEEVVGVGVGYLLSTILKKKQNSPLSKKHASLC